MMKVKVYPKVQIIPDDTFTKLLNIESMTKEHRDILLSYYRDQRRYGCLTKRKFSYFVIIHNKYLPMYDIEFPDTVEISDTYTAKYNFSHKAKKVKVHATKRWKK